MEGSAMDSGPEMPDWVAALRPGEIPLWVSYAGSLVLILTLYAVKSLTLRRPANWATAAVIFLTTVAVAVPGTYLLATDWGNPYLAPASVYVGNPVTTLGVPCASFAWDWATGKPRKSPWLWRVPLELVIAVPLWLLCWGFIELLVLGWIWI
jgi:hypothetical protein